MAPVGGVEKSGSEVEKGSKAAEPAVAVVLSVEAAGPSEAWAAEERWEEGLEERGGVKPPSDGKKSLPEEEVGLEELSGIMHVIGSGERMVASTPWSLGITHVLSKGDQDCLEAEPRNHFHCYIAVCDTMKASIGAIEDEHCTEHNRCGLITLEKLVDLATASHRVITLILRALVCAQVC